jgi:hypothetical protein
MKLLPMRERIARGGEPLVSLVCGVPALSLGLGAMILLLSYLVGVPLGPPRFYTVELAATLSIDALGRTIPMKPAECIVPSMLMLWTLFVGGSCGGLGMYLSRIRSEHRPALTSAAGLISCSIALGLASLLLILWGVA